MWSWQWTPFHKLKDDHIWFFLHKVMHLFDVLGEHSLCNICNATMLTLHTHSNSNLAQFESFKIISITWKVPYVSSVPPRKLTFEIETKKMISLHLTLLPMWILHKPETLNFICPHHFSVLHKTKPQLSQWWRLEFFCYEFYHNLQKKTTQVCDWKIQCSHFASNYFS